MRTRIRIYLTLIFIMSVIPSEGIEIRLPSLRTEDGRVFNDVVITKVTVEEVRLSHSSGVAKVPLMKLDAETRKKIGWTDERIKLASKTAADEKLAKFKPAAQVDFTPYDTDKNSSAQNSTTVGEAIDALAATRWPDDYKMQKFERERQLDAYIAWKKIKEGGIEGVSQQVLADILNKAIRMWTDDYSMRLYETNSQIDAYKKLKAER